MAKVTITIEDHEDGQIHFEYESDPGTPKNTEECTNAQLAGLEMLQVITKQLTEGDS